MNKWFVKYKALVILLWRNGRFPWFLRARFNQIRKTLFHTALAPAMSLGIISLGLAVWTDIIFPETPLSIRDNLIYLVGAFIILNFIIGFYYFSKQQPSDFAKIVIEGRSYSDIFILISLEVLKLCKSFEKCEPVLKLGIILNDLDISRGASHSSEATLNRIEKQLTKLDRMISNHKYKLQCIDEMISLASSQLNISEKRLSDYIFQFSPEVYEERVNTYINYWQELVALQYRKNEGIKIDAKELNILNDRIYELSQNIKYIYDAIVKRISYQEQIVEHSDIHTTIYQMASTISTTSSIRCYAEAISRIAKNFRPGSRKRHLRRGECDEYRKKLKVLYHKRRVHSGFDIHKLCVNFCENHNLQVEKKVLEMLQRFSIKEFCERPIRPKELFSLESFYTNVSIQVAISRDLIKEGFKEKLESLLLEGNEHDLSRIVFVTQGLSRTVKYVLTKTVQEYKYDEHPKKLIYILDLNMGKDNYFESRLIRNEYREDQEIKDLKNEILIGDFNFLSGLVENSTKVVFLYGAECFDSKRRVVNTEGMSSEHDDLFSKIGKEYNNSFFTPECWVLAERFKEFEDLYQIEELYQDHVEHLNIYRDEQIYSIITSDRIQN